MVLDGTGADWRAITELKYAYCQHIDHHQPEELAELFTDDAYIGVTGRTGIGSFEGREEIEAWCRRVPRADRSLHIAMCPRITITDTTATGKWNYSVYLLSDGQIELGLGEYDEQYRLERNEWRIASRIANRVFTIPLGSITTQS